MTRAFEGFVLPPGSIVVVGPNGYLSVDPFGAILAVNCDFIGPEGMTAAHKAIVDERWRGRTEDGSFVDESLKPDLPDWWEGRV